MQVSYSESSFPCSPSFFIHSTFNISQTKRNYNFRKTTIPLCAYIWLTICPKLLISFVLDERWIIFLPLYLFSPGVFIPSLLYTLSHCLCFVVFCGLHSAALYSDYNSAFEADKIARRPRGKAWADTLELFVQLSKEQSTKAER